MYFGGKMTQNPHGFVGADRLGSIGKYYPYGQERPSATANGSEKFTGYLRDAETGLDYAKNRYHNPGTGRFLTPDPYAANGGGAGDPMNPMSWNRYAYVQGDPVNFTDSKGLFIEAKPPSNDPDPDPDPEDPVDPFPDPQRPGNPKNQTYKDANGNTYKNVGNTGAPETKIKNLINFITSNIDPDCQSWLMSNANSASFYPDGFNGGQYSYIQQLLGANNDGSAFIGYASIGTSVGSVLGATTGSGIQGLSIIVNVDGSALSSGGPKYQGFAFNSSISQINPGSQEAGVFTLLHEFAHSLNVPGFMSDAGNDNAGHLNNDQVWQHCQKTLGAAHN